ncbi:hypothetical protein M2152_000886 [Microbacteriaceae bacterium SG_E_30_P1]|uniref:SseB protein N-terminal domain-containing protein n=1 Tax=Antiquaquibacter oligotrophicus TaxID=2880260 RepID=A0ABT6KL19_9MICO|nr:SseB family protein [Antiquaquibacter oligotrophicus]MDH6180704.1 hypothetical protein [Antiquaquibacter oligotrophicus]UDF13570.1 SseB family protein [Antiquaquibacter oligotrophicus]
MSGSDSAGVPWEGRHIETPVAAADDGSAPPRLIEALRRFRAGELGQAEVVDALRESRLLVPLVAELGESGTTETGLQVDKSQELSLVRVAGPDGRTVQPAFTSMSAMAAWNPKARPVPAAAPRVALSAIGDGAELVVLDPTSDSEFVVRRPALWAMAESAPWIPSYLDPAVLDTFLESASHEDAVRELYVAPGDPDARLRGPELLVHLVLDDGLDRERLDAILARLRSRWTQSEVIATRVDSLAVRVVASV